MVYAEYFDTAPNAAQQDQEKPIGRLILQPNNSMSWKTAQYFLCTLMVISLLSASGFALLGYWVILPITIAELLFLSGCFYYLIKRNQTQEVITFAPTSVVIEVGRHKPEITHQWQRFYTKVFVEPPAQHGSSKKVILKCKEQSQEIGRFLNAKDKGELIKEIQQMIIAADRQQNAY